MADTVDELLKAYEGGKVSRRDLLAILAGAGIAPGVSLSAQQVAPHGRLNHVNLKVSNMQRSIAFYEKVFGPGSAKNRLGTATTYQLADGVTLSLQDTADVKKEGRLQFSPIWHQSLYTKPGTWEHIGIEVDNYDQVVAALKTTGVEMSDKGVMADAAKSGDVIWTHDPDGALLQIQKGSARQK